MADTASGGGRGDGEEWGIYNDDGFVYKRRRGLHPPGLEDAAAPSTPAPSLESALLRRRRQALLRLRAKYLLELSRWESLSKDLLAPLPAPPTAPSRPPPDPVAASATDSSDLTVVDDLLAQAEVMEDFFNKLSQACDEIDEFCSAQEAALVDAVAALPVWGDPRELMNSLCSSPEQPVPAGTS